MNERYRQNHYKLLVRRLYGDDAYDMTDTVFRGYDDPVTFVCRKHGEFTTPRRTLLRGNRGKEPCGCPKCFNVAPYKPITNRMTSEEFFSKMQELFGDKYDFSKSEFHGISNHVVFRCPEHGLTTKTVKALLSGKGCDICEGRKKDWSKWVDDCRKVHGDLYEYDENMQPHDYKDPIRVKCEKHGWWPTRYDVHVSQKCKCPACQNYANRRTRQERKRSFIEKCKRKYGDRFTYTHVHYINNDTPVQLYCNLHKQWFLSVPDNLIRGNGGCPMCTSSSGEAAIYEYLKRKDIAFVRQYRLDIDDVRTRRKCLYVDFYLPEYNLFIEYNGEQHYNEVKRFNNGDGGHWTLSDQKARDEVLKDYCKSNGIELLEIPYSRKKPNICIARKIADIKQSKVE